MQFTTATRIAVSALIVFCVSVTVQARQLPEAPAWLDTVGPGDSPELVAEAAILIDQRNGTVLYEKHADTILPPASLTKIMTIHLVLELAEQGAVSLDERFAVPREAWARNMPPHSSLMFLGPGQHVDLSELLEGLAVASGNDAAVAVALRVAGSVDGFVDMMNSEADRLGYPVMRFSDPAGLSARNRITAREYADFLRHHIARWPGTLDNLYSKRELVFPTESNFDAGMVGGSVRQSNRNPLLFDYPGVDGIKTGYIRASGYNLAVSAERDGMRLTAVILGVRADDAREGTRRRAEDGARLLDYGFENFESVRPEAPEPVRLRVWKGRSDEVRAIPPSSPREIIVPRGREGEMDTTTEFVETVVAPVRAGEKLGELTYTVAGERVRTVPLVADAHVEQAGLFKRLWHSLVMLAQRLLS